jgi:hypothetical protein
MPEQRGHFAGAWRFSSSSVGYVAVQSGCWGAGGGGGGTAMLPPPLRQNLTEFKNGFWWQKSLKFSDQITRRHKPAVLQKPHFTLSPIASDIRQFLWLLRHFTQQNPTFHLHHITTHFPSTTVQPVTTARTAYRLPLRSSPLLSSPLLSVSF